MESDQSSKNIALIRKLFLSCTSLQMFCIKDILGKDCRLTEAIQKKILEATVLHPVVKKFPLKPSYQKAFLKAFMAQVENSGAEICEELYSILCSTLVEQSQPEDHHYRHYLLPADVADIGSIVLKESCSFVSEGTTGLCTWQASQALAEWCLSHRALLSDRRILELGSGAGLTGLVASLCCRPTSYIFSDSHPAVLGLLCENVARNVGSASAAHEKVVLGPVPAGQGTGLYSARLRETTLEVVALPWESVPFNLPAVPDIVLAADVVYDRSIFQPLCNALYHLAAEVNSGCLVVLACTVRNTSTLDEFLNMLESNGLHVQSKEVAQPTVFVYSDDPPVHIYTIMNFPRGNS